MDEAKFRLSKIGQIAINVKDAKRAGAFYRDVLGMPLLFEAPGMAFVQCGDVRLMLAQPEKPEFDHPASIIYYKVDDIRASFKTLSERGATVEREPAMIAPMKDHDLWMCFFRDLDGNVLGLMSEVPHA